MPSLDPSVVLPHRDDALYVRRVVAADAESITCEASVSRTSPYRSALPGGDVVPSFLALEMGAQAAAAHEGVVRHLAGEEARATAGFVVRCRAATFDDVHLPADATFTVTARLLEAAPPLRTYRVRVELGGALRVEGDVSTFAA
jgi:predicted hotdog family 3-hydroxylacyl-ACP dehydratase